MTGESVDLGAASLDRLSNFRPPTRVIRREFGMSIRGEVQCSVVDAATKQVLKMYPKQKNLLLNRFMEGIPTRRLANMFLIAVASTGVTPTADDSGTTVAVQATTTVTLSGGSFVLTDTATDAGKIIKWDSGEESRIVTVTSPTVATVTPSQTVSSGEFTVYRSNQTQMANVTPGSAGSAVGEERAGSGVSGTSYLTGAGNCETLYTPEPDVTMTRTYDFLARGVLKNYTELGFSEATTVGGANLNSRILLSVAVPVDVGQQLRVKYSLIITLSPHTLETIASSPITGWATASGRQQIQLPMLSKVLSTGQTQDWVSSPSTSPLEPSSLTGCLCILLPPAQSALPNAYNTNGPSRSYTPISSIQVTQSTPVPTYAASTSANALFIDKIGTFLPSVGNGTWQGTMLSIQSAGGGVQPSDQAFVYIMDTSQVKDSLHSLQLNFRFTWTRVLS